MTSLSSAFHNRKQIATRHTFLDNFISISNTEVDLQTNYIEHKILFFPIINFNNF